MGNIEVTQRGLAFASGKAARTEIRGSQFGVSMGLFGTFMEYSTIHMPPVSGLQLVMKIGSLLSGVPRIRFVA